ncbi:MAG: DNA polymerase III subunit delta' [Clostridia bacterium]|nr:DNA polymerase III subunit delta' [Clostridia bacterium]
MINEAVKEKLYETCRGKLSHAYMICGPDGIGKRTLAREMAKAILCADRENAPCGICRACKAYASGAHPDIEHLVPGGAAGDIKIGEIRRLKEVCAVTPISGDRRVVLIDRAEKMNINAQNAFLKLLEEPEKGNVFVLTCSNVERILPTVRSRCIMISVPPVSDDEIEQAVAKYENASSKVTARQAALYSGGIIGKALDLMAGDEKHPYYVTMHVMEALCEDNVLELVKTAQLITDRTALEQVSEGIEVFCTDVLKHISGVDNLHFPVENIVNATQKLTRTKTLNIIETARQSVTEAQNSAADVKMLVQKMLLSCREEING